MEGNSLSKENGQRLQNVSAAHTGDILPKDLADLIRNARTGPSRHEAALIAFSFLEEHHGFDSGDNGGLSALELPELVAKHLLPLDDSTGDMETQALTAEAALASLNMLLPKLAESALPLSDAALLSVVTYTNASDAWTTEHAASTANHLLLDQLPADKLSQFIIGPLLRDYFRPTFSKSSTRVTSSGRPSYYPEATEDVHSMTRPSWKDGGDAAVLVSRFHWTVHASDESLIASNWPLFTPPLLTLVEDEQVLIRRRGLETMASFLSKCPKQILESSGMQKIIEDAIFPTLMFLPSLTPEAQSVELLHAAYQALLLLARRGSGSSNSSTQLSLDKIFREGIVAAYSHASQHARIVEVLMKYTTAIVQTLGLSAVKHLQTVLSIFTSILQDPFALAYPPGVLATVEALNATIANCWPRICTPAHTEQVITIITTCWLNLRDPTLSLQDLSGDMARLDEQLRLAATAFQALWFQLNPNPPQDMAIVIKREPRVATLFPDFNRKSAKSA